MNKENNQLKFSVKYMYMPFPHKNLIKKRKDGSYSISSLSPEKKTKLGILVVDKTDTITSIKEKAFNMVMNHYNENFENIPLEPEFDSMNFHGIFHETKRVEHPNGLTVKMLPPSNDICLDYEKNLDIKSFIDSLTNDLSSDLSVWFYLEPSTEYKLFVKNKEDVKYSRRTDGLSGYEFIWPKDNRSRDTEEKFKKAMDKAINGYEEEEKFYAEIFQ